VVRQRKRLGILGLGYRGYILFIIIYFMFVRVTWADIKQGITNIALEDLSAFVCVQLECNSLHQHRRERCLGKKNVVE